MIDLSLQKAIDHLLKEAAPRRRRRDLLDELNRQRIPAEASEPKEFHRCRKLG